MLRTCLLLLPSLLLMAQTPAPMSVHGRVLGPDAKPIRGAVVALVPTSQGSGLSPIPEQRSGVTGTFALKASAGSYGLTITAKGYLPHFRNLDLKPESPTQAVDIRLEKGGQRIQGRILPSPHHALIGTRLGFSKISQDSGDQFFAAVKQGRFDVSLAPGKYEVLAEAKGQMGALSLDASKNLAGLQIQLKGKPYPANASTLAWIKRRAIPLRGVEAGQGFADLQPLKSVVGNATVVALGEATHGTREFFQLKHRMLEFLVAEMGFTVFAIEANLPEAFAVDEYVLTGKGNPAKALAGLYFWTWNTEEVLDMIRWMRAYNEDSSHAKKLRFYGVDMQTETIAYAQAKVWLDRVDPAEAANLLKIKQGMTKLPSPYAGKLGEKELAGWAAAAKEVAALISRLEASPWPGEDFDRQRQNLRVLVQFATMQADPSGGSFVRDQSMAANLRWIQSREQGAKVVLWAHNGHIGVHPGFEDGINSMGWHLQQQLGDSYRPFGFAFSEGQFQAMNGGVKAVDVKPNSKGTLDAALAAAKIPFLALDLRRRPHAGPIKQWLESPQGTWRIGSGFNPGNEDGYIETRPATKTYDALFFVNRTHRATPAPTPAAELKEPVNLGFELGLKEWSGMDRPGYQTEVTDQGANEGRQCLQVAFIGTPNPSAWWKAEQSIDATSYRGGKVRLTGWIRTNGNAGFKARCWLRVDGKQARGFYDNMEQRPVTATEWTEVTLEGPVAEDAVNLTFGCTVAGEGTAWFDGLRLERVP